MSNTSLCLTLEQAAELHERAKALAANSEYGGALDCLRAAEDGLKRAREYSPNSTVILKELMNVYKNKIYYIPRLIAQNLAQRNLN